MTLKIEDSGNKVYDFDEAINLTGSGWYNIGLLLTLSVTLLSMCIDMFSFSVIIQLSACDFQLDLTQKSILMSVPFLGTVITAYAWGYISDTRGRRFSLILGMVVSFIMSSLSAFSTNWIVLAVLKLIGTCFCSSAQSGTFAMLGESTPEKIKGKHLLILASSIHQCMPFYFVLSYLIGHLVFSYDLGYIMFVPWRLLTLVLALPLGISAVLLMFFYESPKFLLNAGREEEALVALTGMHRRNCKSFESYPVRQLILKENVSIEKKNTSFMRSLLDQAAPLFKPPLLFYTILLYYYTMIVYGVPSSVYVWAPFLSQAVTSGAAGDFDSGVCSVIAVKNSINSASTADDCKSMDLTTVILSLFTSNIYFSLNMLMSKFASKRRLLIILILSCTALSCVLTTLIPNKGAGVAYFGIILSAVATGPLFAYYVDLYPTSFRGMAACLATMMARISNMLAINLVGSFVTTHCTYTFYVLGAFSFSGVVLSFLLPPDKPNHPKE